MSFIEGLVQSAVGVTCGMVIFNYFILPRIVDSTIARIKVRKDYHDVKDALEKLKPILEWAGDPETQDQLKALVRGMAKYSELLAGPQAEDKSRSPTPSSEGSDEAGDPSS